jgi:hypothetical protein
LARAVVDDLFDSGGCIWSALATSVLVEALLQRGGDADLEDTRAAIDCLAAVPTDPGFVLHEITLLRLQALLGGLTATPPLTRTSGIATATWRKRLATRGISSGPRRCHDSVVHLALSVQAPWRAGQGPVRLWAARPTTQPN